MPVARGLARTRMSALDVAHLPELQRALHEAGVDGWLLYDFHGLNPIATALLRFQGLTTRRAFAWIPADGTPMALSHAIEQGPWRHWPREWENRQYSGWRSLELALHEIIGGKRVAMEYSPGDAVPYLDRVPAGVLDMVHDAGATVVSSAELVSRFYAVWTAEHRASHERAAEAISRIAHEAIARAGEAAHGQPLSEYALKSWILEAFAREGLSTDHGPIVAAGRNSAGPHYEPRESGSANIARDDILLVDLWAREEGGVFADQTWMASLGEPSERAAQVWMAVRDARDAAISLLRVRLAAGESIRGAEVDDAARAIVERRGFGARFIHRTGHSIDSRDLHGSGPHLDNLETREERELISGVGFSIEPGVYLPGEFGMRSEVNGFVQGRELLVTPLEYQRELLVV
jgi:Xaa-Pro dipeptidase